MKTQRTALSDTSGNSRRNRKTLMCLALGLAITAMTAGCGSSKRSNAQALTSAVPDKPAASAAQPKQSLNIHPVATAEAAQPDTVSSSLQYTPSQLIIDAYNAKNNRQWDQLLSLAQQADENELLGAYPMYWYLRQQLNGPTEDYPVGLLQEFISKHQGQYVAERVKAEWAKNAIKGGDFETVLRLQPLNSSDNQAICALDQAKAISGTSLSAPDEIIKNFKYGDNCWGLLGTVYSQNYVTYDQLIPLLRDHVEYDNKKSASRLAGIIFNNEQLAQFNAIMADPRSWIMQQQGTATDRVQEDLRAMAFSRLARQDEEGGIEILRQTELLTPEDKQWAFAQFGLIAALRHEPHAEARYKEAGDVPLSDYNAAWRVRAALYQPNIDWKWVVHSVDLMNQDQQNESVWLYWKGRALDALGDKQQALSLFQRADQGQEFYSLLAREAQDKQINPSASSVVPSAEALSSIKTNASLQRAMALFKMGDHADGVPEWRFGTQSMSDEQLLAAAQWALDEEIYDQAINTSHKVKSGLNYEQLFPMPYLDFVQRQAQAQGIDPAWVYGIIRQESRFVMAARSSRGASGMMQLLPATAQHVANQIGLSGYNNSMVNDPETNMLLGTSYLRQTLDKVSGSEPAATAGYNAGPNRAIRWQNDFGHVMEGAAFIETIPYTETRIYTKNVMSNLANYTLRMHPDKPFSLLKRIGTSR